MEAAQARLSLHLPKYHIVGNHMCGSIITVLLTYVHFIQNNTF